MAKIKKTRDREKVEVLIHKQVIGGRCNDWLVREGIGRRGGVLAEWREMGGGEVGGRRGRECAAP